MRLFVSIFMVLLLVFCGSTDSLAAKKAHNTSRIIYGDGTNPIDYTRTNIIIVRKSLPKPTPKPTTDHDKIVEPKPPETPPAQNPELVFDVEVRDGMALYNQNGWFNLSSYSDMSGVMMAFAKPDIRPIVRSAQYAPADILFIDKQGKISQIAPNILLSELEDDIYPQSPVLAFLFLKGGSCAELSINVGDEVQYSLFKKPPVILNSTQTTVPDTTKEAPKESPPVIQQESAPVQPVILNKQ